MKKLLFILLMSCAFLSNAQDTLVIKHDAYTSVFLKKQGIPLFVNYHLYDKEVNCSVHYPRTNKFTADPAVPGTNYNVDYEGSGYDRGHNMSAEDNACNKVDMLECFYFTNMFPQAPKLNRGTWKSLEQHERDLADKYGDVLITIGSIPSHKTIGKDHIVVPEYCWKVIYIVHRGDYEAYLFPNRDPDSNDINTYKVTLDKLLSVTGVSFNNGMPAIK